MAVDHLIEIAGFMRISVTLKCYGQYDAIVNPIMSAAHSEFPCVSGPCQLPQALTLV